MLMTLISSELFKLCSTLDSLETESNDYNKENQVLTPEYINPDSIVDLDSYSPVNPEEQEIMDMWDRITFGPILKQCTSNEIIDDAYRSHQEYLMGLISPAHMTTSRTPTPNPSSTLPQDEETLDWGSDEEKYIFPSSLCTPYTKDHTVLAPLLKNIKGGTCNNTVDGSEVTQLYNMSRSSPHKTYCMGTQRRRS